MNTIKLTELYKLMIDDIFELLNLDIQILSKDFLEDSKKVQAFDSMKEIDKKLYYIVQMIQGVYIKDYYMNKIKRNIGEFLDNLKISNFYNNECNWKVDYNDILLVYGIFCGISIMTNLLYIDNYPNFKKLVMSINKDYEQMNNYYSKRFNKFKNTSKNKDVVYSNWIQLLLRKEINKVITPKQKKKE